MRKVVQQRRDEFKKKKWNWEQYKNVMQVNVQEYTRLKGYPPNSLEELSEEWNNNKSFKESIIFDCLTLGLGKVEGTLAFIYCNTPDTKLKETQHNCIRYREGLECAFQFILPNATYYKAKPKLI